MKIELSGIKEIQAALSQLHPKLMRSAEKAVLRAGAEPIKKAAKIYAERSRDSGILIKSISVNVKTIKGVTDARIGPSTGERQVVTRKNKKTGKKTVRIANPNKYSHLVEYGTSHSAAKPFIRPAIDSAQGETFDAMAKGLEHHLTKTLAKVKSKIG